MPEVQHFTVTQTRSIEVSANSAADAAQIAAQAFGLGQSDIPVTHVRGPHGIWGNTTSKIKEVDMRVTRRGL